CERDESERGRSATGGGNNSDGSNVRTGTMDEMRNGHNGEDDENERVSATGTTAKTDREQRKRASGAQLRDERENVKCELGGNLLFWVPKTSFIYYWDSGKGGAAYDECYLRERMRDYKSYGHPCYAPIGIA
ncbi:hypothetical protein BD779DRAFT_1483114, partial [Infundibulicybe gibba]